MPDDADTPAFELLPEPPIVSVLHFHPRALTRPVRLRAFLRHDPLQAMPRLVARSSASPSPDASGVRQGWALELELVEQRALVGVGGSPRSSGSGTEKPPSVSS